MMGGAMMTTHSDDSDDEENKTLGRWHSDANCRLKWWIFWELQLETLDICCLDKVGIGVKLKLMVWSGWHVLSSVVRKKDKDKKKGGDKKKAINEDSVAANKKSAAAETRADNPLGKCSAIHLCGYWTIVIHERFIY